MKKYLIIGGAVVALIIYTVILYNLNLSLKEARANDIELIKAYDYENSGLKDLNRAFKLTVEQFSTYKDSVTVKMRDAAKELGIKDSKISSLLYLLSEATREDSITLGDTVFVKDLAIDTVIQDKWYRLELSLKYPNLVVVKPKFKNETYIAVSGKRETINPPKKFFLLRWFLKKHTVATVDILERSPYSEVKQQRFIQIIKD